MPGSSFQQVPALPHAAHAIRRKDFLEGIFDGLVHIEADLIHEAVQALLVEERLHSAED